uniref:E3 ubiquitin-protein ligase DTX1-like n=1 Tax=Myxine glutinosa TaxID=7769 RepID=UPI00358F1260
MAAVSCEALAQDSPFIPVYPVDGAETSLDESADAVENNPACEDAIEPEGGSMTASRAATPDSILASAPDAAPSLGPDSAQGAAQVSSPSRSIALGTVGPGPSTPGPKTVDRAPGVPVVDTMLVAVWEWLSEQRRWRPYGARVSRHIEAALAGPHGSRAAVVLGQAEPALVAYIVDLQAMCQFRQDTGTIRQVRRRLFPVGSALGRGIVWKWEQSGSTWATYEADVCVAIQDAYERRQPGVDLSPLGLPYYIDFNIMCQINGQTRFRRRVLVTHEAPYPTILVSPSGQRPHQTSSGLAVGLGPVSMPSTLLNQSWGGMAAGAISGQHMQPWVPGQGWMSMARFPAAQPTLQSTSLSQAWPLSCGCQQCQASSARAPAQKRKASTSAIATPQGTVVGQPALGTQTTAPSTGPWLTTLRHHAPGVALPMAGGQVMLGGTVNCHLGSTLLLPGMTAVQGRGVNSSAFLHSALTGGALHTLPLNKSLTMLHPPVVSRDDLRPVPGIEGTCRHLKKTKTKKGKKSPDEVVKKYLQSMKNPPEEDCTICMERLTGPSGYEGVTSCTGMRAEGVGRLGRCTHAFHVLCLIAMYSNGNKDGSLQCPTCKTIYGEKTGTQPKGLMEFHVIPYPLPSHADCHTIRIIYDIHSGTQGPEHPNPGKKFTARGFPRHCYLADDEKGRKILRLLVVAWERRLVFTVGTSNTTGETDTVVWNEIHHKTEFGSNVTGHGYPDPNYMDNVLAELAAQGVHDD